MTTLLSIDNVIKEAKQKGVDFGKGDPYNRLRYYTKIGWLPHMSRQRDAEGNIKGHYPSTVVDQIVLIEDLKTQGLTNDEIEGKINTKNKLQTIISGITSKELRNQILLYTMLVLLILIVSSEMGIINLGKSKDNLRNSVNSTNVEMPNQVVAQGVAFVPNNQRSIFIKSDNIKANSKVYITFNQDYSPATRYWVSQIKDQEGFLVETDAPVASNAEFNWWFTN